MDKILNSVVQKIMDAYSNKKDYNGIPSGFIELDRMTQGWQKSNLIIVAGRTSMGKTAFVLSLVCNMILEKRPVLFFSLEMSAEELAMRLITMEACIEGEKIKSGRLTDIEMQRLEASVQFLKNYNTLYIDDSSTLNIDQFRNKVQQFYTEYNMAEIIIAKQRNGRFGGIKLYFYKDFTKVTNEANVDMSSLIPAPLLSETFVFPDF